MAGNATSSPTRVVMVSPSPGDAKLDPATLAPGVQVVCVSSGYEAAAEILAAPAAALVIDLRMLHRRHLRLLALARERGVETLVFGSLSAELDADELSGVRLVARRDLPEMLNGLVRAAPKAEPSAPEAPVPEAPAVEAPKPPAVKLAPAKNRPAQRKKPQPSKPTKTEAALEPGRLLTADELAALLENEQ